MVMCILDKKSENVVVECEVEVEHRLVIGRAGLLEGGKLLVSSVDSGLLVVEEKMVVPFR